MILMMIFRLNSNYFVCLSYLFQWSHCILLRLKVLFSLKLQELHIEQVHFCILNWHIIRFYYLSIGKQYLILIAYGIHIDSWRVILWQMKQECNCCTADWKTVIIIISIFIKYFDRKQKCPLHFRWKILYIFIKSTSSWSIL